MQVSKHTGIAALLLALCFCLAACAPSAIPVAEEPSAAKTLAPAKTPAELTGEKPAEKPEEEPSEQPETVEGVLGQLEEAYQQRAEKYAVEIRTLENGVQVQRTPAAEDNRYRRMRDSFLSTNNFYLNADNRGCGACHEDLADLVDSLTDYPHCELNNGLGIEATLQMCLDCHNCTGTIESQNSFGGLMHGLHDARNTAFTSMGGDCWSCHYGTDYEGMELWDVVKHDVLRGITNIGADVRSASSEFTWNQDKVVDVDNCFTYAWMDGQGSYIRYAKNALGLEPDPASDGIYDSWKILIAGEVKKQTTMTLAELIEAVPPVTTTLTMHCMVNPMGGPLISNVEVTGIPLSGILEMVGVKDTARSVRAGADGTFAMGGLPPYGTHGPSQLPLEWVYEYEMYLALAIGGKPISYEQGYPVMFCTPIGGAYLNYKEMTEIVLIPDVTEPSTLYYGGKDDDGTFVDMPNVGICEFMEGQIIEANEPYTFEGYAHTLGKNISAVEFSFDQGKTWTTCPVENADLTRWVYWNFTWTPPSTGSYVIIARCVDEDGGVSPEPVEKLINAQ